MAATPAAAAATTFAVVRRRLDRDDIVMRAGLVLLIVWMFATLVLPLWALLSKSFQNPNGEFVGLANYLLYFSTPVPVRLGLEQPLRFGRHHRHRAAAGLRLCLRSQRSCMRWKGLFQALALIPILAPSLLPAISLVYLFGNQGFLKELLFGALDLWAVGIIVAQVFYCLPARADDPGGRAVAGRRAGSTRRRTCSARRRRADLLHRDAAGRKLRR